MLPQQTPPHREGLKRLSLSLLILLIVGSTALIVYTGVSEQTSTRSRINFNNLVNQNQAAAPAQMPKSVISTTRYPDFETMQTNSWRRNFHRQTMIDIKVTGKVTDKRLASLPEIAVVLEIPTQNIKENAFTGADGRFSISTKVTKDHIIQGTVSFNPFDKEYLPQTLNVYFFAGNLYSANFPDVQLEDIYDYVRLIGKVQRKDNKDPVGEARIDFQLSSAALDKPISHDLVSTPEGMFALSEKGLFKKQDVKATMKFYKKYYKDVNREAILTYDSRYLMKDIVIEMEVEKVTIVVKGTVHDHEGKPYPQANVLLQVLDQKKNLINVTATVDSKGAFQGSFPDFDNGTTYEGSVVVSGQYKKNASAVFQATEENKYNVELTTPIVVDHIREQASVVVNVIDNNGKPLQGADIGFLINGEVVKNATADAQGQGYLNRTVLKGIGEKGTVQAHHEFFVADKPEGEAFQFSEDNKYTKTINITVKRKKVIGSVSGVLQDEDRKGISGVNIKVFIPEHNNFAVGGATDKDGKFKADIPDLERGLQYTGNITVENADFAPKNISLYLNETNRFHFLFVPGIHETFPYMTKLAVSRGKVVDAENGSNIVGADVKITMLEIPKEVPKEETTASTTENSTASTNASSTPSTTPPSTTPPSNTPAPAKSSDELKAKSVKSQQKSQKFHSRKLQQSEAANVSHPVFEKTSEDGYFSVNNPIRKSFKYNGTVVISKPGYKTKTTIVSYDDSSDYAVDLGVVKLEQEKINATLLCELEHEGTKLAGVDVEITVYHENNKKYFIKSDVNGKINFIFEVQKIEPFNALVKISDAKNKYIAYEQNVTFSDSNTHVVNINLVKLDHTLVNLTIKGVIHNNETKAPVSEALLKFSFNGCNTSCKTVETQTLENGTFSVVIPDQANRKNYTLDVNITKENYDSLSTQVLLNKTNNYTEENLNILLQQEKARITIWGRVYFEDQTPAEGISVKGNLSKSSNATVPDFQKEVFTNSSGIFEWNYTDHKGPEYFVNLSFEKPQHIGVNETVIVSLGNLYRQDLGIIEVKRVPTNGSLTARFLDSEGKPLVNAPIDLAINGRIVPLVTDTEGKINYTDTQIFRGTQYNVTWSYAGSEHFSTQNGTTTWNEANNFTQSLGNITIIRESVDATFSGVALDEYGNPIPGATVSITLPGTDIRTTVTTDDQGRYNSTVRGLESGRNYSVQTTISAEDKEPIILNTNISSESNYSVSGNSTVPFIPREGSIRGQTLDGEGLPIENVNVSVVAGNETLGSALTGKDGSVNFPVKVMNGLVYEASILVNHSNYKLVTINKTLSKDNSYTEDFKTIILEKAFSNIECSGKITFEGGPVEKINITVELILEKKNVTIVTDDQGRFHIKDIAKHGALIPARLVISDPVRDLYKTKTFEIGFYEGNDYKVVISSIEVEKKYAPLKFNGLVLSETDKKPVANASLNLSFGEKLNWSKVVTTDANGAFNFEYDKMEKGVSYPANLTVDHPDHKKETFKFNFDPANNFRINDHTIELGLLRGNATIRGGPILDADGKPFANGNVTIRLEPTGETVTVPLDENGNYVAIVPNITLGPNYTANVSVVAPGYQPLNFTQNLTEGNNYAPSQPTDIPRMLPTLGFYEVICRGQLVGLGGLPMRLVPVLLVVPREDEKKFWAMTDGNGYLEYKDKLQGVPQLPCTLSITDPNGVYLPNNETKMHVNADGWLTDYRYVSIQKAEIVLKGVVKDSTTGKPLSGANVTVQFCENTKSLKKDLVTGEDGSFAVKLSDYPRTLNYSATIKVNKTQYNLANQTVQFNPQNNFQNESVVISVNPRQITVLLEGRVVDEDGKPIEGALVEAIYGDLIVNTTLSGPSGNYSVIVRDARIGDGQPGVVRVTPPPKARRTVLAKHFTREEDRIVYKVDDVKFSGETTNPSEPRVFSIPATQKEDFSHTVSVTQVNSKLDTKEEAHKPSGINAKKRQGKH